MGDVYVTSPTFVGHDSEFCVKYSKVYKIFSAGSILAIDCHPSGKKFITCGQKAVGNFLKF